MSSRISHKQRLLRFFPTPRVLAMPAVGVDISDEYIRIISLVPGSKSRELALWAEQKLPQGTIEDGIINNSKEVISTLSSLKKEHDLEFVHASLPDEKTYIFRADIPTATDAEVQTAIEFKIQENVPLSPTEVIFDYTPIVSHQATTVNSYGVVVVPKKVTSSYLDVYHRSGLIPLSFNTVSQAVSRSVIAEGDISTSLIVHMCENKTGLYIVRGGVVQFASIVKIGGNTITSLVQKHFKVSFEEAARIKRQKVFSKSKENSELFFSLINELSVLRDEVSKVFNYWRSHAKDKKEGAVEKVILCGEDALVSGIDRYISLVIPCEIKIANVWTNAFSPEEYVPDMPMVDSLNYAGAVGLALLTF